MHDLYYESMALTNSMSDSACSKVEYETSDIHVPSMAELKQIFETEASLQNDLVDLVAEHLDCRVQASNDYEVCYSRKAKACRHLKSDA